MEAEIDEETRTMQAPQADHILTNAKASGLLQIVVCILCGVFSCPGPALMALPGFIMHESPHHCRPDDNYTSIEQIPLTHDELYEKCIMYDLPSITEYNSSETYPVVPCRNGWVFESQNSIVSLVEEWQLVCGNLNYVPQLSSTLFLIGVAIGSLFIGTLADRYGRIPILSGTFLVVGLLGVASAFSGNWIWLLLSFFNWFIFTCWNNAAV